MPDAAPPDPLWEHFVPLWKNLNPSPEPVLIGGYGLKLKQRWLRENAAVRTVVPSEVWPDARATFDIDLALRAEIVLDIGKNKAIRSALATHGWQESDNVTNRNWQFVKSPTGSRLVKVEFHAPIPLPPGLPHRLTQEHLMPKQSLGSSGIHAFPNPEAVSLAPTTFDLSDGGAAVTGIRVPHPLNMAVMKLKAMADQRESGKTESNKEKQDRFDEQAGKHASDAVLAVAMMTTEEAALAPALHASIRSADVFPAIRHIAQEHFLKTGGWGRDSVGSTWRAPIPQDVLSILSSWFA